MKKFFYRVTASDTLCCISKRFNVPQNVIIKLNGLKKEVEEGDLLYIESDGLTYTVKPLDTVYSIAEKYNISPTELLEKNDVPYIFVGQVILI